MNLARYNLPICSIWTLILLLNLLLYTMYLQVFHINKIHYIFNPKMDIAAFTKLKRCFLGILNQLHIKIHNFFNRKIKKVTSFQDRSWLSTASFNTCNLHIAMIIIGKDSVVTSCFVLHSKVLWPKWESFYLPKQ